MSQTLWQVIALALCVLACASPARAPAQPAAPRATPSASPAKPEAPESHEGDVHHVVYSGARCSQLADREYTATGADLARFLNLMKNTCTPATDAPVEPAYIARAFPDAGDEWAALVLVDPHDHAKIRGVSGAFLCPGLHALIIESLTSPRARIDKTQVILSREALLAELAHRLGLVRAPRPDDGLNSRTPAPALTLCTLAGMTRQEFRTALGEPDSCARPNCEAGDSWVYFLYRRTPSAPGGGGDALSLFFDVHGRCRDAYWSRTK